MDATEGQAPPPILGLDDVLHVVESWPPDRVLALTRRLAGSLPAEGRAAVARELLAVGEKPSEDRPRERPSIASLVGLIPWAPGSPTDLDAKEVREERLRRKYGPW